MNLRQFRTVVTFLKQQSFASTGDQIGLSPSAVSIQMLRFEQELGIKIFNRSTRPPTLTVEGFAIAEIAHEILELEDKIRRIAKGIDIAKSITIGFVPTTLTRILPRVITCLRHEFPDLQINIKSGLSGELAAAVLRREIDYALITAPSMQMPELVVTEIAREPLFIVGPQSLKHVNSAAELITALPFIAFNKRAWLGQKIAADLQIQAIYLNDGMEIDSLDTIEQLVSQGFGVSVIPQRLLSPPLAEHLKCLPFGYPSASRILSLIEHIGLPATELERTVRKVFQSLGNQN
ncbi:LysR substrate-binding domain-containing protein [Ochrobactrum sp. BTU1]|uniref:LysR substrate-binding domain-containing protein n=1 Tax=Ochrobactrum sp. BTU1 TaxID=2840456 RepID=UPI001C05DA52|nr:LysR family transcriptional regulator [Ochrobactrum sp. BTU1]